jgi:REP element-mobilizing transposase RayT
MSIDKNRFPRRKQLAKGVFEVDGQPTIVFDTVCTKDRGKWLATYEAHQLLVTVWTESTAWSMGRYMIMPDHIHFFAGLREGLIEYEDWITYWKSHFSKRFKRPACRWQTDGFDTRVRSAAMYEEKWHYVRQNPVRAGLVAKTEDWNYQGEIFKLRWD